MGDSVTCSSDPDLKQFLNDQVLTNLIKSLTLFKSDKGLIIGLTFFIKKNLFRKPIS